MAFETLDKHAIFFPNPSSVSSIRLLMTHVRLGNIHPSEIASTGLAFMDVAEHTHAQYQAMAIH